jgi:AcrR family transcriptional regulator
MTTRADQRRRSEQRILAAARRLFAEHGYDRTTVRAIAAAADSDAGLVMRYFGSKEKLFAQAATIPADEPITGTPEQIADQVLASLAAELGREPGAALAALRATFTHPETGHEVRTAMTRQQHEVAAQLPGDNAVLRAGLLGALTLGTVLARHRVRLDGVRDATPDEITAALERLVRHLTSPTT